MALEPGRLPVEPESLWQFRAGQLLVLLAETSDILGRGVDVDRLAYYDFFAANPFLMYPREAPERVRLALAGFDARVLNYASSAQRFANRRRRLEGDLAMLAVRGLARASVAGRRVEWSVDGRGREIGDSFSTLYAKAYRTGAAEAVRRLRGLSDRRLRESAADWLKATDFLVDLAEP